MTARGERGSMTAELVVLTPVLILFTLLAVGLGRYEQARAEIVDAARAGAQAASVSPAPSGAPALADATVGPALAGQLHLCRDMAVETDTSTFAPGGTVGVRVTCRVDLSDLLVPGLPGAVSVTATQVAPVDPYRTVR